MLRGKVKVMCEKDGERWEVVCKERDLISVPPGVYRGEINIGEEEALMCVMLGSPRPITPTYPPDHPLAIGHKFGRTMEEQANYNPGFVRSIQSVMSDFRDNAPFTPEDYAVRPAALAADVSGLKQEMATLGETMREVTAKAYADDVRAGKYPQACR